MCFGVYFCSEFCCFLGLATTDRETPRYVKFVDRLEKFVNFQKTQGHKFRQLFETSCLGICCFFGIFSDVIFVFLAHFQGRSGLKMIFWVKN